MVKMKHKILLLLHYFTGNSSFIAYFKTKYTLLFYLFREKNSYVAKYFVRNKKNSWLERKKPRNRFRKDQFPEQIRFGEFLMFYFK